MNHLAAADELYEAPVYVERTVRTTISVPAWATADQVAEAMEILDPSLEPAVWRGVLPGWGATTIYAPPRQTA